MESKIAAGNEKTMSEAGKIKCSQGNGENPHRYTGSYRNALALRRLIEVSCMCKELYTNFRESDACQDENVFSKTTHCLNNRKEGCTPGNPQ